MEPEVLELEESDVQEHFFENGWTDGLPIVPPTLDRVAEMLDGANEDADSIVGSLAERGLTITAEQVAINAVMAGCKPAYFPLVLAAVEALLDVGFNANAVLSSTGGAAPCAVVSGPLADEVGMNSGHNALGPGNRANATIGRSLRLVAINLLGARTGGMDGSTLGNPGKYTLCFAESTPPDGWDPLRVRLGFDVEDTTVTLIAAESPRTVANHLNGSGEGVLRTFAAAMRNPSVFAVGKGHQVALVLGPEHAMAMADDGWATAAIQELLCDATKVTPAELEDAGVLLEQDAQHDMTPDASGRLTTIAQPDDILLVTAGGAGAGWSAYIPAWAPKQHSVMTTRRVRPLGEELPECGDDGCIINWD
jgi:hypothetical protein